MLRSGQFDNLKWNTLAKDHAANWDRLRDEFGLPLGQIPPSASLDELATMSVQAFRKHLFTNTLTKQVTEEGGSYAEDMEGWLTPSLLDHLIVTFAYRFLVDNLPLMKQPECIRAVYDCRAESDQRYKFGVLDKQGQPVRDTDAERELRDNYSRSRRRSCGDYGNGIERFLDLYKDLLRAGYEDALEYDAVMSKEDQRQEAKALKEKRKQLAPFYVVGPPQIDRTTQANADFALIDRENEARVAERYAVPNWVYSLAMAGNWDDSPLKVKRGEYVFLRDFDKTSLAFGLAKFLGSQEWGPLLFQTEEQSWRVANLPFAPTDHWVKQTKAAVESWQSQIPPAAELRVDKNGYSFVAIPYVKEGTYKCDLPPKS
ncbi:MAG: hypothetical protein K2N78_03425, partial [Oscillospiraceae bacterium]|nr:hypothetical protein [Oscillospiraceae bacterium]